MEFTNSQIKAKSHSLGFDLCGIASIDRFDKSTMLTHPAEILPGCQSIVVVARKFLLSSLNAKSTIPYTIVRNHLSNSIDQQTLQLSYYLEEHGYNAVPTGAIEPCNYDAELQKTVGLISLKYAAYNAGLGVIGKNTLLITPQFGNMVWLGAVLTDAKIEPDHILTNNPCKDNCRRCLDNCPIHALDGSEFMNQKACWDFAFGAENGGEWRIKCFTCRSICPFSKGYRSRV